MRMIISISANYPLNETNNVNMRFKKGFTYLNKPYGWHEDQLYKLPYNNGKRWYNLLKCAKWKDKGFIVGNGVKKSFGQLYEMTHDIDFEIKKTHPDTPF
jgi:hypothetical protein